MPPELLELDRPPELPELLEPPELDGPPELPELPEPLELDPAPGPPELLESPEFGAPPGIPPPPEPPEFDPSPELAAPLEPPELEAPPANMPFDPPLLELSPAPPLALEPLDAPPLDPGSELPASAPFEFDEPPSHANAINEPVARAAIEVTIRFIIIRPLLRKDPVGHGIEMGVRVPSSIGEYCQANREERSSSRGRKAVPGASSKLCWE